MIYREYDIRGIVPDELDEERVMKIGYLLAEKIEGDYVVVGYDARLHSRSLFDALASGLNAGGKVVLDAGMVPTPVVYFCHYRPLSELIIDSSFIEGDLSRLTPAATVMITGSHNPPEYNGFKITIDRRPFFGEEIYELGRKVEGLEKLPTGIESRILPIRAKESYIAYMLDAFSHVRGLPISIVADCGNGAAGAVLPQIFDGLELDWNGLYCEPDGTFPNHHPDPGVEENLTDLKAALGMSVGDLGFAYDGDADRLGLLTRRHNIKGDLMALLFASTMRNPVVIGEVKCSQVMYDELERSGATPVMYKTGHSNLKVKIRELDADLACEVSGHIFFNDRYYGFDDAIYATLRVLELIQEGIDLDGLVEALPPVYATEEIKVETTEEEKFLLVERVRDLLRQPPEDFPEIRELIEIDGVRIVFDRGWALVRASNTTPVLVTRFEADDPEVVRYYEVRLNEIISEARRSLRKGIR
ncbi:phosphomannomutase/phosphoglucomutase [Nitratifractor sp.]